MSVDEPVFLRALEDTDVERTHRWHNDQELFSNLIGPFRYVSNSAEKKWIERKMSYDSAEINLAICEKNTGTHVGNIYLYEIDWISRCARMGILIGEAECRGKGYGRSAIQQVAAYAFGQLNLRRIHLSLLKDNTAAQRAYEKCGFVVEGILSRHVYKNGDYHDVLLMALMRRELSLM